MSQFPLEVTVNEKNRYKITRAVGAIGKLMVTVNHISDKIDRDIVAEYRKGASDMMLIFDHEDSNKYFTTYIEARKWASSLHSLITEYGNEFTLNALNALLDQMDYEIGPYIG